MPDSGTTVDAGHPDATIEGGTVIDGGTADSLSPADGAAETKYQDVGHGAECARTRRRA